MRKAEFKLKAEKGTRTNFKGQAINTLSFFKSCQYRWESDQTADPQIDDISYHMYMNYAYIIDSVEPVALSSHKNFADLRNDRDSTHATYAYVATDLDELANDFEKGYSVPFNKINKGSKIIREFLADQGHPNYIEELEED